jgi:hypothetical protein
VTTPETEVFISEGDARGEVKPPVRPEMATLKHKHALRSFLDLTERRRKLDAGSHLISGLLPSRSVAILVGDSGLGKSPLFYQAALCIAAGVPFLGLPVRQGPVLMFDFENGLAESEELIARLAEHLRLKEKPENFLVWNANDSASRFGQPGHGVPDIIRDWSKQVGPGGLVLIDPVTGAWPDIEEKNSRAVEVIQQLRAINRECGTTFWVSHHLRKPPRDPQQRIMLADCGNSRDWFKEARGASAFINASDIRLGVDIPGVLALTDQASGKYKEEEIALVLRGFGRVRGEIGPIYLARRFDAESNPIGYRRLVSEELLFNADQQEAFKKLPNRFTTGEAKAAYGRRDQATADMLGKYVAVGIARRVGRGIWEKLERADLADDEAKSR